MTANSIKGINSAGEMIPGKISNGAKTDGDFSQILKNSTDSKGRNSDDAIKADVKNQGVNRTYKQEKASGDTKKAEETGTDNKVNASTGSKTEDVKSGKETKNVFEASSGLSTEADSMQQEVDEATMEVLAGMSAQLINTISETLQVPVEQVEAAIEALGLENVEILNPAVIPSLVVEITDNQDVMSIMTDEQLYNDVNLLKTETEDLMDQLSRELEIPVDELEQQIKIAGEQFRRADADDIEIDFKQFAEAEVDDINNQDVKKREVLSAEDKIISNVMEDVQTESRLSVADGNNQKQKSGNGTNQEQNQNSHNGQFLGNETNSILDRIKDTVSEKTASGVSYTTEPEKIYSQVAESLKVSMKEDITEMEMQLHPASLGNVRIQIASRAGAITANFITQNEQVRAALETQMIQLREQLSEQGIKVEAVEVTVASHSFDSNLAKEGDRGEKEGEEAQAVRGRRRRSISLNALEDSELGEALDEEEQVVADMMKRSGNSVDFMA